MDSRTPLLHDEHSVVDNWRMEFFDNFPTCIQGGVDPQAPFQLNLSKISGSLVVESSTFDSLLDLLAGGVLLYAHRCMKDVDIYNYLSSHGQDGHRHAQLRSFIRSYSGDFPQSNVHLLMANLLQAQSRSRYGIVHRT
ncbi:hypothetical protein POM88_019149 [Heracleum sosnowskyi]|uniref:Uncharacterized protein n=1 Tax=Heracleum sosnowskyi TaxID=360622 RepID=A0AAD8IUA0_9APIA|nr:hypothetical protein POM88_019149 [Heracleum sosnowskyi]